MKEKGEKQLNGVPSMQNLHSRLRDSGDVVSDY
jgi:hypothetical protein